MAHRPGGAGGSEAQHRRMLETPIPRLVISMAVPTMASQLISVLYNTADTFFVGRIGTSASAAVGVVFSLMSIIQAFGFGVGMGASSLISRALGAHEDEQANRYANSALCAALAFGLLLMLFGLPMVDGLVRVLGATETMLPHARTYARFILAAAPLMCSAFVLSNLLRAEGDAVLAMWGLCTGGLLNIVLDPLFIFGLKMGVAGAALATVLSQAVSFTILLSAFLRGRSILRLSPRLVSRSARDYLLILKTGLPTICRQGMASLASALLNIAAAVYGDAAVAAVTISNKVYMLVRNLIIGIGQGFQPVAGYNFGAGARGRVREAFRFCCMVGTVVCTLAGVVLYGLAPQVIGLFRDDPAVIEIGAQALRFACMVMPLMAYSTYVNQMYQCLGFAREATLLACCRQGFFFIPLILLLPSLLEVTGVTVSQPASDLLTFVVSVPFQIAFHRRVLRDHS